MYAEALAEGHCSLIFLWLKNKLMAALDLQDEEPILLVLSWDWAIFDVEILDSGDGKTNRGCSTFRWSLLSSEQEQRRPRVS
jgi:hypothetical protein